MAILNILAKAITIKIINNQTDLDDKIIQEKVQIICFIYFYFQLISGFYPIFFIFSLKNILISLIG